MSIINRMRKQVATYWSAEPDAYGGFSYGPPQVIECRWEDKLDRITDEFGREIISRTVVYVDRDLSVGGFLALGDHSASSSSSSSTTTVTGGTPYSPEPTEDARPIRRFDKIPNLRNTLVLRQAWL